MRLKTWEAIGSENFLSLCTMKLLKDCDEDNDSYSILVNKTFSIDKQEP